MPTYDFACPKCFSRGVVSNWEMELSVKEPKVSFCPVCGEQGRQVILKAPAYLKGRSRYAAADAALETAYQQQTGLSVGGSRAELSPDPVPGVDLRARFVNAETAFAAAAAAPPTPLPRFQAPRSAPINPDGQWGQDALPTTGKS